MQRILRSISKRKRLYQPITMSCGHSARGAVHPQSKGGVETQGAVQMQRVGTDRKGWGHFAKDIYVRNKVGLKRKRTSRNPS